MFQLPLEIQDFCFHSHDLESSVRVSVNGGAPTTLTSLSSAPSLETEYRVQELKHQTPFPVAVGPPPVTPSPPPGTPPPEPPVLREYPGWEGWRVGEW